MTLFFKTDYHTHTWLSPDGHSSMFAMCSRAVELGLRSIAFTEHVEWQNQRHILPPLRTYFQEIDDCRDHFGARGLTVLSGVEIGNPHEHLEEAAELLSSGPFDVIIASLHWLYGKSIQMEACFRGREANDVYADYFSAIGEMAAQFDADIIAHFDRIMWRGALMGIPLDPRRIEATIRDALATIAWCGSALEINTRYLRNDAPWLEALVLILRWYVEEGGTRLAVNSDAHGVWQLGENGDVAYTVLQEVGLNPVHDLRPANAKSSALEDRVMANVLSGGWR